MHITLPALFKEAAVAIERLKTMDILTIVFRVSSSYNSWKCQGLLIYENA